MNNLSFYFNNNFTTPVSPPLNWQDIQIELAFENESPEAALSTTKLEFVGPEAAYINQWAQSSTGGLFLGIPLQIQVSGTSDVVFNGIINLSDTENEFQCDIVKVKIQNQQIDMFNGLVQSINFAFLAQPSTVGGYQGPLNGQIRPYPFNASHNITNPSYWTGNGDFITIQYQRNDVPDTSSITQAMLLAYQIYQQAQQVPTQVTAIINDITAGVDLAALVVTIPAAIADFLEAALEIIILTFNLLLIVSELAALITLLIPPIRHKFGMFVSTLFERVSAYFGFNFSSSILGVGPGNPPTVFSSLVWMPTKKAWPTNNTSLMSQIFPGISGQQSKEYDDYANWSKGGQFSYGYPDESCSEWIRIMEDVFNAKCKIIPDATGTNSTMYFERWDYQYNLATYTLPDVSSEAPFAAPYSTNAGELASNYELKWGIDSEDYNCLDQYVGVSCVNTISNSNYSVPTNGTTPSQSTLRNLVKKELPVSHAIRKDNLSTLEQIVQFIFNGGQSYNASGGLNLLLGAVNDVTSTIDSISNDIQTIKNDLGPLTLVIPFVGVEFYIAPTANFGAVTLVNLTPAIGAMLLSSDVTGSPKLFIVDPNPVADNPIPFIHPTSTGQSYVLSEQDNPHGNDTLDTVIGDAYGPNMSAQSLMQWFHFSSQATCPGPPTNGSYDGFLTPYIAPYQAGGQTFSGNQWVIYKDQEIPLCASDYNIIKNNNYILIGSGPYGGSYAWVETMKWNPYKGTATITYWIRTVIAPQIYNQFIVDGSYWGTPTLPNFVNNNTLRLGGQLVPQ